MRISITSTGPQVGKTTVAAWFADKLNTRFKSTSDILAERLCEERPSLTIEQIESDRAKDPEAHRGDLIRIGTEAVNQKRYASIECLERGFTVIEGTRYIPAIPVCRQWCKDKDESFFHIHIKGEPKSKDTTQGAELEKMADVVIDNSGSLSDLYVSLQRVYDQLGLFNYER